MKDEWRRRSFRGGLDSGLGRDSHANEMGSKQKNSTEFEVGEVEERRA